MNLPKFDFSKENPYNTFGKKEFLDANTGKTVKMVTNDYRSNAEKGAVVFQMKDTLEDKIKKIASVLPEVIDLKDVEDKHFLYTSKPRKIHRDDLNLLNWGAIEAIYIYYQKNDLLIET